MPYKPIHKLLVANRGEIAVRIIQTARRMGITTIGITTAAEPFTTADESFYLPGHSLAGTYLNEKAIVQAALKTNADAIHPGYGFLSENQSLAKATTDAGVLFVGPPAQVIAEMGDKTKARKLAQKMQIPLTKAVYGSVDDIFRQQKNLPFPLLVKAAAGGGGKGMRLVSSPQELLPALQQAQREALNYFGDDRIFVEHYIHMPRHIEVQILADQHGNCIHLFERECSIQRRYQKMVEEAPSPVVNNKLRTRLTDDAIKIAQSIGYEGAGTVEFLVDNTGQHFFLEMNTRLQVEHPVTEAITGIDIVEQQLLIAMGLPLSLTQKEIKINGHALECRIYAEDPDNDFRPEPGPLFAVQWPERRLARTDTWFHEPTVIQPDFDPMLAKIITHAPHRNYAIGKMRQALSQTILTGSTNNIWYLQSIMQNKDFVAGKINTGFCEIFKARVPQQIPDEIAVAAALTLQLKNKTDNNSVWHQSGFYRFNNLIPFVISLSKKTQRPDKTQLDSSRTESEKDKLTMVNDHSEDKHNPETGHCLQAPMNDTEITIGYTENEHNELTLYIDGKHLGVISQMVIQDKKIRLFYSGQPFSFNWAITPDGELLLEQPAQKWNIKFNNYLPKTFQKQELNNNNNLNATVKAPIPGKITQINIQEGDYIKAGHTLLVLEAMKMENRISMPRNGVITKILAHTGIQVKANQTLVEITNESNKQA
ncbi:acetyl/propionyl/methylcrotonyl-CoA carboxylase subunit alpha [Geofilum sp. OHC36d9]|uniref:acetyl/propionyl/methylcrotonyl-CoA carboxylase subunit alpha n=1 Tax=Geofilum sp. OHC36d9 TaxID=3458413 RepID=UPI0040332E35